MQNFLNKLYIKGQSLVERFRKEERGDSNIISVILIIVVVIAMAVVFRNQITTIVTNLFDRINKEVTNF